MAKQTFTVGQVLTAAQLTSLQQTAMLGGAASAKTASYTLVAADAGSAISMTSTSATTITVNTGLFAAGDTVQITNLGSGVSTITAGTATVNTSASLALAQYESGTLDFTSTSAAIFIKGAGAAAGGGKVLQVVGATTTTQTSISSNSYTDSGLTASITPSLATSKVLIMISSVAAIQSTTNQTNNGVRLMRGATSIGEFGDAAGLYTFSQIVGSSTSNEHRNVFNLSYLDSPSTTSSTTYKIQARTSATTDSRTIIFQHQNLVGSIILMEIGA
jgi:hypothetical protein